MQRIQNDFFYRHLPDAHLQHLPVTGVLYENGTAATTTPPVDDVQSEWETTNF